MENRLIFTAKDGEVLRSLFEDMIVGKSSIVKAHFISKLRKHYPVMLKAYTENQILSRIRSKRRAYFRKLRNT